MSNETNQPTSSIAAGINIPPSPRRPRGEEPMYQTLMAPLAVLLVYAAAVAWLLVPDQPLLPVGLAGMGVLFFITSLALRPGGFGGIADSVVHWSRGYQALNWVLVIAVTGIVVLVNIVAYRHSTKHDYTMNQTFSLSDQTRQQLQGLKDDVTVTAFYPDYRGSSQEAQLFMSFRKKIKDTLDDYMRYSNGKFHYDMVDPLKDPISVRKAGLTEGEWGAVIVEQKGGRKVKVPRDKIFSRANPWGGGTQFKGEEALTGALLELESGKKITIYFVVGHGEKQLDSDQPTGYGTLKPALEHERYAVKTLQLFHTPKVPDDCSVLVIAGPNKPFQPKEIDAIRAYMAVPGHGALFLVDYTPVPGFKEYLAELGIEWSPNIIVESNPENQIDNPLTFVAAPKEHAITKELVKNHLGVAFSEATYLNKLARPGDKFEMTPIVESMDPMSWAEYDLNSISTGKVRMDPGVDKPGPLPLGWAIEIKQGPAKPDDKKPDDPFHKPEDKKDDSPKTRAVVIGNSVFPSDILRQIGANTDLFLNSIAWAAFASEKTATIRAKDEPAPTLTLTADKASRVKLFTIFVYPFTMLVIGFLVWYRRSNL